jgi:hypothetical protein
LKGRESTITPKTLKILFEEKRYNVKIQKEHLEDPLNGDIEFPGGGA